MGVKKENFPIKYIYLTVDRFIHLGTGIVTIVQQKLGISYFIMLINHLIISNSKPATISKQRLLFILKTCPQFSNK